VVQVAALGRRVRDRCRRREARPDGGRFHASKTEVRSSTAEFASVPAVSGPSRGPAARRVPLSRRAEGWVTTPRGSRYGWVEGACTAVGSCTSAHAPAAQELDVKGKGGVELTDEDWQTQFTEVEAQQHEPVADEDAVANKALNEELTRARRAAVFGTSSRYGRDTGRAGRQRGPNALSEDWIRTTDTSSGRRDRGQPPTCDYMFEPRIPLSKGIVLGGRQLMESGVTVPRRASLRGGLPEDPNHVQAGNARGLAGAEREGAPAIRALERA